MGKQENCINCTYRLLGYKKRIWCVMLGAIVGNTQKCKVKKIGLPLLDRIELLEKKVK